MIRFHKKIGGGFSLVVARSSLFGNACLVESQNKTTINAPDLTVDGVISFLTPSPSVYDFPPSSPHFPLLLPSLFFPKQSPPVLKVFMAGKDMQWECYWTTGCLKYQEKTNKTAPVYQETMHVCWGHLYLGDFPYAFLFLCLTIMYRFPLGARNEISCFLAQAPGEKHIFLEPFLKKKWSLITRAQYIKGTWVCLLQNWSGCKEKQAHTVYILSIYVRNSIL